MTRAVIIDGREVLLRASAAIPRLYRIKFHRDILADMQTIKKAIEAEQDAHQDGDGVDISTLPLETLTLFEDVAYLMAKHADKDAVPNDMDEWLDQFGTFSIYRVFPVIQEMWDENLRQLNFPQKK